MKLSSVTRHANAAEGKNAYWFADPNLEEPSRRPVKVNKYLLTFTGRLDGSSKFGSANQYAFFPSAALAWRVTEESFMQSIPAVSNLKVRASYGATGNSEIPAYRALAGMSNNISGQVDYS